MNDEFNSDREPPPHSSNGRTPGRARSQSRAQYRANGNGHAPGFAAKEAPKFGAADFLPFVDALGRRWLWLLLGGVTMNAQLFSLENSVNAKPEP